MWSLDCCRNTNVTTICIRDWQSSAIGRDRFGYICVESVCLLHRTHSPATPSLQSCAPDWSEGGYVCAVSASMLCCMEWWWLVPLDWCIHTYTYSDLFHKHWSRKRRCMYGLWVPSLGVGTYVCVRTSPIYKSHPIVVLSFQWFSSHLHIAHCSLSLYCCIREGSDGALVTIIMIADDMWLQATKCKWEKNPFNVVSCLSFFVFSELVFCWVYKLHTMCGSECTEAQKYINTCCSFLKQVCLKPETDEL